MTEEPLLQSAIWRWGLSPVARSRARVDRVSFQVKRGRTLGIVGESGCGKSVTVFRSCGSCPNRTERFLGGSIRFEGQDLVRATESELHRIRGTNRHGLPRGRLARSIPFTRSASSSWKRCCSKPLTKNPPDSRPCHCWTGRNPLARNPHQEYPSTLRRDASARRHRHGTVVQSSLLIADEPPQSRCQIQAQILELMLSLQRDLGMAIVLITHISRNRAGLRRGGCDVCRPRSRSMARSRRFSANRPHPYTGVSWPRFRGSPRAQEPSADNRGSVPDWPRCPSDAATRTAVPTLNRAADWPAR